MREAALFVVSAAPVLDPVVAHLRLVRVLGMLLLAGTELFAASAVLSAVLASFPRGAPVVRRGALRGGHALGAPSRGAGLRRQG